MSGTLQPLPSPPESGWSDAIHDAYTQLMAVFDRANRVLVQEADPLRIQIQAENIGRVVPLLDAMEACATEEELPQSWINDCAFAAGELLGRLQMACESATVR
jgi:hypothetical protein